MKAFKILTIASIITALSSCGSPSTNSEREPSSADIVYTDSLEFLLPWVSTESSHWEYLSYRGIIDGRCLLLQLSIDTGQEKTKSDSVSFFHVWPYHWGWCSASSSWDRDSILSTTSPLDTLFIRNDTIALIATNELGDIDKYYCSISSLKGGTLSGIYISSKNESDSIQIEFPEGEAYWSEGPDSGYNDTKKFSGSLRNEKISISYDFDDYGGCLTIAYRNDTCYIFDENPMGLIHSAGKFTITEIKDGKHIKGYFYPNPESK